MIVKNKPQRNSLLQSLDSWSSITSRVHLSNIREDIQVYRHSNTLTVATSQTNCKVTPMQGISDWRDSSTLIVVKITIKLWSFAPELSPAKRTCQHGRLRFKHSSTVNFTTTTQCFLCHSPLETRKDHQHRTLTIPEARVQMLEWWVTLHSYVW